MPKHSLIRSMTFAIVGLFSAHSGAISNIENQRPGLPDEGLSGQLELGLEGKTGNQREKTYSGAAKVVWRQQSDIFLGLADRAYGSTSNVRDTNEAFVHARWIHLLSPRWAAETFAQWEEDEFDNLESRSLIGGGGRHNLIEEQDRLSITVGLGAFREREVLDLVTYEEITWATRLNSYITYSQRLNDQVIISSTAYYQPDIDQWDDFRVLLTLALAVNLTDTLKLQLNYKVTHDSDPAKNLAVDPPINNYETNTEYATNLVYSF